MKFRFFIGGYFSSHFEIFLKKDNLLIFDYECPFNIDDQKPTHSISINDNIPWQNLVNYIEGLKWQRNYNSDALDGIQWELTFENQNKKMKCFGNNAYPTEFDNFTSYLKKIIANYNISDELLSNNNNY